MWRKKQVWGFFCVLLLLASLTGQVRAAQIPGESREAENIREIEPPDPEEEIPLYASAAALIDADSGRILYGKNADTPMAMASTTKIMTCILILENCPLDEVLTVSSYAAGMPQVKLGIRQGEEYTVRDLLYSLMLESHNDSAVALAEHVGRKFLQEESQGGSAEGAAPEDSRQAVAAFAGLMNEKASELGCEHTWFITPNGLDASEEVTLPDGSTVQREHCTTAGELAEIMAYCIMDSPKRELFLEITRTADYSFYANGRNFSCVNHNAFLNMMDGALSGKTGFTNKAGYCYVGALESEGRTFVVALLACGWPNHKTYKWSDTRKLMQYGIDNFFYKSFDQEGTAFDPSRLAPVVVEEGRTEELGETACTRVAVEESSSEGQAESGMLLRKDEEIKMSYTVKDRLTAPVEAGAQVGTVEYSVNGIVCKEEKLVAADGVERIGPDWCAWQILKRFLLRTAKA